MKAILRYGTIGGEERDYGSRCDVNVQNISTTRLATGVVWVGGVVPEEDQALLRLHGTAAEYRALAHQLLAEAAIMDLTDRG